MNMNTTFAMQFSLFLAVLGLCCCEDFCLVVVNGGYSLVEVHRLLPVASLVAEHELQIRPASVVVAHGLQSTGSTVVVHRLTCSPACGIFPNQGSNQCLLHWQVDSLPLSHQGSPCNFLFVAGRVPWRTSTLTYQADCWVWGCKLKTEVEFIFMVQKR